MSGAKLGLLVAATAWKWRSPDGAEGRKGGEGLSPVSLFIYYMQYIYGT